MPFLPVGGQAVIEGVMMRSPSKVAVAVRRADGTLAFQDRMFESVTRRVKWLGMPVLRGAVGMFETLRLGMGALNFSADETAKDEPAAKGDGKAETKGSGVGQAAQLTTMIVAFALGILLFVVLPAKLTGWLGFHDRVRFGLVDGAFRLSFFVLYLLLISQWKEMARVLGFHGAEHKAIHAVEAGAPLTPESVQTFSRFHPRCGTTFLFYVVAISIVVFSFVGRPTNVLQHAQRVLAMPLIAGVAFEVIRWSGKHASTPWVRALSLPGMQFQRLTTREPDLEMCRVAIASLERVLDDPTVVELRRTGATPDVTFVQ